MSDNTVDELLKTKALITIAREFEARIAELEAQLAEAEAELERKGEKLQRWGLGMNEWVKRAEKAEAENATLRKVADAAVRHLEFQGSIVHHLAVSRELADSVREYREASAKKSEAKGK